MSEGDNGQSNLQCTAVHHGTNINRQFQDTSIWIQMAIIDIDVGQW